MGGLEDQNGLREALASDYVLIKRGLYYRPDNMGYTGVLDDAGLYTAEDVKRHHDWGNEVKGVLASEAPRFSQACWPEIVTQTLMNDLRAAEAEITRLKEGMEALLPSTLCGESWGCPDDERVSITVTFGAIRHARSVLATLSPKEHPHG